MNDRIHYTYISFRIASVIYLILAFLIPWYMQIYDDDMPKSLTTISRQNDDAPERGRPRPLLVQGQTGKS